MRARADGLVAVALKLLDLGAREWHGQRLLGEPARLERVQGGPSLARVAREARVEQFEAHV